VAPLAAVALWPRPVGLGRGIRTAVALAAALVVAGIAGDSRILWPALLAAALVAFAAFVVLTPREHPGRRAARRALAASLVLLPILMVVSSEYKLRVYPRATSTFESFSFDERPLIWATATRAFVERPLLGHGYGREIVAARLRADLAKAGQATPYNHGHNVFLDAAIQMGVVGLAAFAALVACLAWAFAEARRKAGGAALSIAGLALVTGYFAKNLTDDFFFRPNSLVFWAISGMLLGLAARLPARG
jgi:Lipid A core - O-antigen ligase and related enzymes